MSSRPQHSIHVQTSIVPIRWGDMDAFGHVNNTVYFRYMEQARLDWLLTLERTPGARPAPDTGPVIVNASCTFHEPLVYPGACEVRMYLGGLGRSSLGTFYEIWKDGRMFADGAAKMVWVDRASGRSTPLPDVVAAPLRKSADAVPSAVVRDVSTEERR
jgi:acyl-CoA thioester hydrolase